MAKEQLQALNAELIEPAFLPAALYKGRARIEQGVGKLKRFKRIALRGEKTAANFLSFITSAQASS